MHVVSRSVNHGEIRGRVWLNFKLEPWWCKDENDDNNDDDTCHAMLPPPLRSAIIISYRIAPLPLPRTVENEKKEEDIIHLSDSFLQGKLFEKKPTLPSTLKQMIV